MKRTHKFGLLRGEVADVMASAPSLAAAAAALGVDKSTVFRWRKANKIPAPGGRRGAVGPPPLPEGWAASVRAAYDLNATETELVSLAEAALVLARDASLKPADRLAAMSRFSQLVRQIDLEVPDGEVKTRAAWPRRLV